MAAQFEPNCQVLCANVFRKYPANFMEMIWFNWYSTSHFKWICSCAL